MEEQSVVAGEGGYLDLEDREGVSEMALGVWEKYREHCFEEHLI